MRRLALLTSSPGPSVVVTVMISGIARSAASTRLVASSVAASGVLAGSSRSSISSPWSGRPKNSRPTELARPTVPKKSAAAVTRVRALWFTAQVTTVRYQASRASSPRASGPKTGCRRIRAWWSASSFCTMCALSIGSTVKETSSDTSTAAVTVMPNSPKMTPARPGTKATGRKTATTVKVVAITARAISSVPLRAAVFGSSPISRCRKMFSRTTTESSMSRPTTRLMAIMVMMLSVKPSLHITKKVTISEVGSASAEMSVERQSSMKTKTTSTAKSAPSMSAAHSSCRLVRMKREPSKTRVTFTSAGSRAESGASAACTASTTATVLVPDRFCTSKSTQGLPLTRARVRTSFVPSTTRPRSETRTWAPVGKPATTTSPISWTVR